MVSNEHGKTNHGPLERAGLQSLVDSEWQPPGAESAAEVGWVGDGQHCGTNHGPLERAGAGPAGCSL